MIKFIELTRLNGNPILINISHIQAIEPNEGTDGADSLIYTTDRLSPSDAYCVKENYKEIKNLIEII